MSHSPRPRTTQKPSDIAADTASTAVIQTASRLPSCGPPDRASDIEFDHEFVRSRKRYYLPFIHRIIDSAFLVIPQNRRKSSRGGR